MIILALLYNGESYERLKWFYIANETWADHVLQIVLCRFNLAAKNMAQKSFLQNTRGLTDCL